MFRLLDNDVWIRELVGVAAKRGSLLSGHHPSWGAESERGKPHMGWGGLLEDYFHFC